MGFGIFPDFVFSLWDLQISASSISTPNFWPTDLTRSSVLFSFSSGTPWKMRLFTQQTLDLFPPKRIGTVKLTI